MSKLADQLSYIAAVYELVLVLDDEHDQIAVFKIADEVLTLYVVGRIAPDVE